MEAKDEQLQKKIADLQSRLDEIEASQQTGGMCQQVDNRVELGIEEVVDQV